METLFEKPEKKEVDRTEIIKYNILFQKIGYRIILDPKKTFESKSEIIGIQNVETKKYILTMQWLRPVTWPGRGVQLALDDYPRLNIPPVLHSILERDKIKATLQMMKEWDMYFLVIVPVKKINKVIPEFWLGRYDEIPEENLKLNWWKTKGVATRLLLQKYNKYKFVDLKGLKTQLDKIFETL